MEQRVSFAGQVKKELSEAEPACPHCKFAQTYGMLLFSRGFSARQISIQTEHKAVVDRYAYNIIDLTGAIVTISYLPSERRRGSRLYVATVEDERDSAVIRRKFGHEKEQAAVRLVEENMRNDCCKAAFLRGAFMVCGSVINPEKEYHLEFVVPYFHLSEDLQAFITGCGIPIRSTTRKGSDVLYLKESEHIEDMLTLMGATQSSLELMNVKIMKDVRNKVNRVTNCETANIEKTVAAAQEQISDIQLIQTAKGFAWLPEDLQELAQLRLENPDLSLRELCTQLSEPLSRSGVNHRLKRLSRIAQELRDAGYEPPSME